MQPEITYFSTKDKGGLLPLIKHNFESIRGSDGSYMQIYNYYAYEFSNLPDAEVVCGRVYFGERTASLTGLSPRKSPASAKLICDYYKDRMFDEVTCLSPDNSENDPKSGYFQLWSSDRAGEGRL